MNDDIVTRLREQVAKHFCYYDGDKCADCRNANEAADEIERLRQEVAAWKDVAQELTMYGAMHELKEAAGE